MKLTTAMILDVILIAVLLGIVWRAWKAGFVSAFISLVGSLAGYLGAAVISGPISDYLYITFAQSRVQDYVLRKLPNTVNSIPFYSAEELSGSAELKEQAVTIISEALQKMDLDFTFLTGSSNTEAADAIFGKMTEGYRTVAEAVTEVVVGPAVEFILRIVVFFVVFLLIMLVVRLLVSLGKGFNHVPLVGGVNRLLGLGLGLVHAAVVGYLITVALLLIVAVSGNKWEFLNYAVLEDTKLITWFKNLDFMSIF